MRRTHLAGRDMSVSRSPSNGRLGRDGFVLVAVLSVTALLALLVGGAALLSRGALNTAVVGDDTLRAQALLRSGIELAGHQLFVLRTDPSDLNGQQLRLDTGTVTIFVASEAGRVDLNGGAPLLLAAAYRAAGLTALEPDAFAALIANWRRGAINQTTDSAPSGAPKPSGTPFRAVADMRYVPGLSSDDVAVLTPLLTVSNPAGRIDPMFASVSLLQALPGVPQDLSSKLEDARARTGLDRIFYLRAIFRGLESQLIFGEALRVFRVRVEARATRSSRLHKAEAVMINSVLSDRPFMITDWRSL